MVSKPKPLSSCCEKPAKVDMTGTGLYFCSHCGVACELSQRRTPFKGSTLSPIKKVSGERALFVQLWAQRGGRSQISGAKLLPPEHAMFHWQFAHVLPKGTYPDLRLDPENVFMVTVDEHHYQTHSPEACRKDPSWHSFWATFDRLKSKVYTH